MEPGGKKRKRGAQLIGVKIYDRPWIGRNGFKILPLTYVFSAPNTALRTPRKKKSPAGISPKEIARCARTRPLQGGVVRVRRETSRLWIAPSRSVRVDRSVCESVKKRVDITYWRTRPRENKHGHKCVLQGPNHADCHVRRCGRVQVKVPDDLRSQTPRPVGALR